MTSAGDFQIQIKRNIRAKRMNLRYDPTTDCAVITLPRFNNENDAIVFVNKNLEWLQKQRVSSPDIIYLAPEQIIPLYGEDHLIKHRPDKTGRVIISSNEIIVGGHVAGFSVRLENYLKKQTRQKIEPLADSMSQRINKSFKRIQIRDTISRWGSCSSSGNLSFSWRLVMTPPSILEYVVAHEIAHLKEMNHSPAFWDVVDRLVPNAKQSRRWLRSEGKKLLMIKRHDQ